MLCPTIQQRCVGQDQQYQSVEDCTAQLLTKEFGTFDEVWGDNIVCRMIHLILTVIRPDVSTWPTRDMADWRTLFQVELILSRSIVLTWVLLAEGNA